MGFGVRRLWRHGNAVSNEGSGRNGDRESSSANDCVGPERRAGPDGTPARRSGATWETQNPKKLPTPFARFHQQISGQMAVSPFPLRRLQALGQTPVFGGQIEIVQLLVRPGQFAMQCWAAG